MPPSRTHRIPLILVGITLFLVALPTSWMRVRNPKIFTPLPQGMENAFRDQTIEITGLTGAMSFLSFPDTPIWIIVGSGILACAALLLNALKILSIPNIAIAIPLLFTALFSFGALYSVLHSSDVSIGIGTLASIIGVLICGYTIMAKEKKRSGYVIPRR